MLWSRQWDSPSACSASVAVTFIPLTETRGPANPVLPRLNAIPGEKMRFTEINSLSYPARWHMDAPVEAAPEITCPICHGQEFHITGEGRRYCLHCPWEDE